MKKVHLLVDVLYTYPPGSGAVNPIHRIEVDWDGANIAHIRQNPADSYLSYVEEINLATGVITQSSRGGIFITKPGDAVYKSELQRNLDILLRA